MNQTRICPRCGRGNLNTNTFCAGCGQRLATLSGGNGLKLFFGAFALVAGLLWGTTILTNQNREPIQSLPPAQPLTGSATDSAPASASTTAVESASEQTYKVKRVIDGSTLVVIIEGKEVKVRLIGVDTPETASAEKAVAEYGKEASQFVKNLLEGEPVYLEYELGHSRLDKKGRTLAYVYRSPDRLFVNQEVIRQGYGHTYAKYPFKHLESFRSIERAAKEAGKGLWGQGATIVSDVPPAGTTSGVSTQGDRSQSNVQTGRELTRASEQARETTVYVTRTGEKYHRDGCRYLSRSRIPMSLKDAKMSYSACSVCRPPR